MNKENIKMMKMYSEMNREELKEQIEAFKRESQDTLYNSLLLGMDGIDVDLGDGLVHHLTLEGKLILRGLKTKRNPPEWIFSPADVVSAYTFKDDLTIKRVVMPFCKEVETGGFQHSVIEQIDFPALTDVGTLSFSECSKLKDVELPNCQCLHESSFSNSGLRRFRAPECEKAEQAAFFLNTKLKEVSLPKCTYIGAYVLNSTKVEELSLPSCKKIDRYAFYGNRKMKKISAPCCEYIEDGAFAYSAVTPENAFVPDNTKIACNAFDFSCSE